MTLDEITTAGVSPALALLPPSMDSAAARVLMLAIAQQESNLVHRFQVVQGRPGAKGPARGFWQFELGGVKGVMLHAASKLFATKLCADRNVAFTSAAIHTAIETDDVLAAGIARLLIFTDAAKLPAAPDEAGGWALYAKRCWRPGKPHPETWPAYHRKAREFVMENPG